MTRTSSSPSVAIVDGHVHIYDCFDPSALLDSAYQNMVDEARRRNSINRFTGFLLLAETAATQWYEMVAKRGAMDFGPWTVRTLPKDRCSVLATKVTGESLVIVAGRQIATAERLEVLALFTEARFDDGLPADRLLGNVAESGALAVVAWGAGKWLGKRGDIVSRLLESAAVLGLTLGDNGGRPTGWPESMHFRKARQLCVKILPGSDPLPLAREIARIGSFGATLHVPISPETPAHDLYVALMSRDTLLYEYGHRVGLGRFLTNQMRLRSSSKAPRHI